jgi:hypothetical protein
MSDKLYWYSLCFIHGTNQTNSYLGAPLKCVNIESIRNSKKAAKMPPESLMTSCCYLGYMTKEEFEGKL